MKKNTLFLCLLVSCSMVAQTAFRTQTNQPNIKTFQIDILDKKFQAPIIELNGTNKLQISFDQLSHEAHTYGYKVLHCNADWTQSNLSTNEYLSGYTTGNITDYSLSVNTTVLYTHYAFQLPNDDLGFKISGNYVVFVYENGEMDNPIAQACFSVVEPRVNVDAKVRGNTDIELNGRFQQLDFDVEMNGYPVNDPANEIKIVVRQNNRIDNQVSDLKPSYIASNKLSFINNKSLIFEGGSEYHRFDISSVYASGEGVSAIRYSQPNYNAYLYANKIKSNLSYIQDIDVNGKYIINMQKANDDNTEADYIFVHFTLPTSNPFFDGQLYLGGEFNFNSMNDASKMNFSLNTQEYSQTLLLKQGGYNYQYWFVPKGEKKATTTKVDGSYWQTSNEYTIYVYHRPWGGRYDKLVAVKRVE